MRTFVCFLALLLTSFEVGAANLGDIELWDIETANLLAPGNQDLIGGTIAKPEEWPSSFASSQGGSGCTATLLGPQALQLAAHCVGNGKTSTIKIGAASYSGTCAHHPSYRSDDTADWALCKMTTPVDRPWYERVLEDASKIKVGTKVLLAGNGCISAGGRGGEYGTFRTGEATVTGLPLRDNDTVTRGGAALCYGDSGGSAFYVEGLKRYVFGVNSRGNIRDTSYLSSTFVALARNWYRTWADQNGVKICGVHADAVKCQGGEGPGPGPSPSPQPQRPSLSACWKTYDQFAFCMGLFGHVECVKKADTLKACVR